MEIQNEIQSYIVESILFGEGQQLEPDMLLHESGILDSTGFLEIITFVEEKFGIAIADSEVIPENFGTLRKMSRFVEVRLKEKAATPLRS
ncbi:MAG: acyl carrier protein [Sedimentisphaerales bacterium]|nr:acyl carrier protein [Sedimentisphaerales bacterium]